MRSHIKTSPLPTTRKGMADGPHPETTKPGCRLSASNAARYMKDRVDRKRLPNQEHNDHPHMASATYAGTQITGQTYTEDARAGNANVRHTRRGKAEE